MKKFIRSNLVLLLFFVSALIVLGISIYAGNLMTSSAEMISDSSVMRMKALADLVAEIKVPGYASTSEMLAEFTAEADMDKADYAALKEELDDFAIAHNITYAYYMRLTPENKMQFIVDNVLDPADEPDGLDSAPVDREATPDKALLGETACSPLQSYSAGWDGLLTAYAPVYEWDAVNNRYTDTVVAIAGVDVYDNTILTAQKNIVTLSVVLVLSMIAVLGSGLAGIILYKQKAAQAESSNDAKSGFLSRMSHEMRTPMNAIVGLCRMARESDDINVIKGHLENISASSRHLRQVIDDVLDLSKIEAGKIELEIIPVDSRQEMEQIAKIIRPQCEAKDQKFTLNIGPDVPRNVYCDSTHVRQIIVNLLSNAVKFTPDNGEISLSVNLLEEKGGKYNLEFAVKDNGIGIEPERIPRLFRPFEQGDGSTTRKYGGSGLGLSISKQLVEMMGGTIGAESKPGTGSVFKFNIWVDKAPETSVAEVPHEKHALDLSGQTVLLVEDSEINQLIADDVLRRFGAKVEFADNGKLGVDKYCADPGKYSIILMDIQMPVMDGYEATKKIRASGMPGAKTIPIIAMTANVFREDVQRALKSGMDGHVGKPFEIEQVEEEIAKVLQKKS